MIKDYTELLEAKNEIAEECNSYFILVKNNIGMKETEVSRMAEIEGKMKAILDNLNEEKDIYLE